MESQVFRVGRRKYRLGGLLSDGVCYALIVWELKTSMAHLGCFFSSDRLRAKNQNGSTRVVL